MHGLDASRNSKKPGAMRMALFIRLSERLQNDDPAARLMRLTPCGTMGIERTVWLGLKGPTTTNPVGRGSCRNRCRAGCTFPEGSVGPAESVREGVLIFLGLSVDALGIANSAQYSLIFQSQFGFVPGNI